MPAEDPRAAGWTDRLMQTAARWRPLLLLLALIALTAACTPMQNGPVMLSTPPTANSADLVGPPTPTVTAMPTPPKTLTPTPDTEQVSRIVAAARHTLQAKDVDPLCLRWEDTDGDGEPEWLGLYLTEGDPMQLQAFVLDGETWYDLNATEGEEHGLGAYPACQLEVDDINVDGRVEIAISGRAETTLDLLHVFVWDGSHYRELASFQGDAGVSMADVDGTPGDEIIVRHNANDGLAWETIHTWNDTHYTWTWDRYQWLHADFPHAYLTETPERAVISFYLALSDRDLPGAYDLLTAETKASNPYQNWAAEFNTTLSVEVGSVYEIDRREDTATVTAQVRSYDNVDGYVQGRLWDVTWVVSRQEDSWRLSAGSTTQLSKWEVPYID